MSFLKEPSLKNEVKDILKIFKINFRLLKLEKKEKDKQIKKANGEKEKSNGEKENENKGIINILKKFWINDMDSLSSSEITKRLEKKISSLKVLSDMWHINNNVLNNFIALSKWEKYTLNERIIDVKTVSTFIWWEEFDGDLEEWIILDEEISDRNWGYKTVVEKDWKIDLEKWDLWINSNNWWWKDKWKRLNINDKKRFWELFVKAIWNPDKDLINIDKIGSALWDSPVSKP